MRKELLNSSTDGHVVTEAGKVIPKTMVYTDASDSYVKDGSGILIKDRLHGEGIELKPPASRSITFQCRS